MVTVKATDDSEFERAAALTRNEREQALLMRRATAISVNARLGPQA